MTWLTQVPIVVVRACLAMLPRLQAEESIRATNEIAIGVGTADARIGRETMARWLQEARGSRAARIVTPTPGALAAIGIAVR